MGLYVTFIQDLDQPQLCDSRNASRGRLPGSARRVQKWGDGVGWSGVLDDEDCPLVLCQLLANSVGVELLANSRTRMSVRGRYELGRLLVISPASCADLDEVDCCLPLVLIWNCR